MRNCFPPFSCITLWQQLPSYEGFLPFVFFGGTANWMGPLRIALFFSRPWEFDSRASANGVRERLRKWRTRFKTFRNYEPTKKVYLPILSFFSVFCFRDACSLFNWDFRGNLIKGLERCLEWGKWARENFERNLRHNKRPRYTFFLFLRDSLLSYCIWIKVCICV